MKKALRIILFVLIIGVFVWTLYFLYGKSQEKPIYFSTHTPYKTNIVKKTVATGSIVPEKEVAITPKVSGVIQKIYKEAGDHIKKGEIIAKIQIVPNMASLNNAESRVKKAKINLKNAEQNYNRNKSLFDKGVIAEAEFQQYSLKYNNAKEELQSAIDNLEITKSGSTASDQTTTNTLIRSTIDGMILDIPVKVGNSVIESNTFNDGTTIASVADMGQLIFEGNVDESEVGKLKEGMDILLSIGALPTQSFHATLNHIAPQGVDDEGAIQFEIKAVVKVPDSVFIRAGYSANANIVLSKQDSVMAISESWLQFDKENKPYVEVKTGKQSYKKEYIKTGLSDGINIQVRSGLNMNDEIKDPNSATNQQPKKG